MREIHTESTIDYRTALLLQHCECIYCAATFCLCTSPLLQEPGDVPHPIVHCFLTKVCCVWRTNPVRLISIFKVGATEESDNCGSSPLRQSTNLKRVNSKIATIKQNSLHCSSVSSVRGSLGRLICLWGEHQSSYAHDTL